MVTEVSISPAGGSLCGLKKKGDGGKQFDPAPSNTFRGL